MEPFLAELHTLHPGSVSFMGVFQGGDVVEGGACVCVNIEERGVVRKQQVGGHCPTSKEPLLPPQILVTCCFTTQMQTDTVKYLAVYVCEREIQFYGFLWVGSRHWHGWRSWCLDGWMEGWVSGGWVEKEEEGETKLSPLTLT